MLEVRIYDTIKDIDPLHWDGVSNNLDYFHSHKFVSVVEDSRVENARFQYLLVYDGAELVGTTVLSTFSISLDLFIKDSPLVARLKQLFPNLFSIKLITCGLPASFGQLNISIKDAVYAKDLCGLIALTMRQMANASGIKFMAIKELRSSALTDLACFEQHGFFLGNSIPYMHLRIRWKSFDEYLTSLRHPYRRRIMLSLKKLKHGYPKIVSCEDYQDSIPGPFLLVDQPCISDAASFYHMYLSVMGRSPTKLETLNQAFFEHLFAKADNIRMLSVVAYGKKVSSALLLVQHDTLTFMLAGRENEKDDYDSYFNLINGIIAYAIEGGYKNLKLGQTAYWVKQSIGAEAENEYLFFASTSRFWHTILKNFRNILFPVTQLKDIHAFRESGDEQTREESRKIHLATNHSIE